MNFLQTAIKAAKEAGKIQSRYFGKGIAKTRKHDDSFVTKVDVASSRIIKKIILGQFPEHGFLDEELKEVRSKSDYKWIVDPLDGTHEYIMGNPIFGVSIALEHKKEIILGVVYFPVLKKLYYAEKGKGAFCNGKRIKVSSESNLKKCMFIFDAKLRDRTDLKIKILRRLAKTTWRIRIYGVSVFHNLLVAEGDVGFNVDFNSNPWDHSASLLIVEEAGGKITDLEGRKWNPYMKDYIASNGKVHDKVLQIIRNS